jgi:plasmid stabilization system protein ParE
MKYRLTEAAVEDIREIVRQIRVGQRSPQNAKLVARRLKKQFAIPAGMPGMGHIRPELRDDSALVIAISGVLVIYDPRLKPLTILRVIHVARDLGRIDPRK